MERSHVYRTCLVWEESDIDRCQQIMVHGPNLAHCLFVNSLQTKNGVHIFKKLEKNFKTK